MHLIGAFLEAPHYPQMASPRESRFKPKVNSPPHREFNFSQHQSARSNRCRLRRERRHSLRDQVRIDEISAVSILRQEFPRKRSLPRAIRSRDDVDIRAHKNSEAYLQLTLFARKVRLVTPKEWESMARLDLSRSEGRRLHTHPCRRHPRYLGLCPFFDISRLPTRPARGIPLYLNPLQVIT